MFTSFHPSHSHSHSFLCVQSNMVVVMMLEKNSSAISHEEIIESENCLYLFRTYVEKYKVNPEITIFLMTEKFSMLLYQFLECDCLVQIFHILFVCVCVSIYQQHTLFCVSTQNYYLIGAER